MNRTTKTRAFTLTELLIVIGIIAILVAIGAVAGGKAYRWASIKETRASMAIIMNAVMAYQENMDFYPNIPGFNQDHFLLCVKLDSSNNPDEADAADGTLGFQLVANDFALERIKPLPSDAFSKTFETNKDSNGVVTWVKGGFVDAWGNPFLYSPAAGLGGTPVLVSAGPDGKIWDGSGTSDSDVITLSKMGTNSSNTIDAEHVFDTSKPGNKDNISSDSE